MDDNYKKKLVTRLSQRFIQPEYRDRPFIKSEYWGYTNSWTGRSEDFFYNLLLGWNGRLCLLLAESQPMQLPYGSSLALAGRYEGGDDRPPTLAAKYMLGSLSIATSPRDFQSGFPAPRSEVGRGLGNAAFVEGLPPSGESLLVPTCKA